MKSRSRSTGINRVMICLVLVLSPLASGDAGEPVSVSPARVVGISTDIELADGDGAASLCAADVLADRGNLASAGRLHRAARPNV